MTNFLEWLIYITAFLSIWYSMVTSSIIPLSWVFHAWLVPVYTVLLFGVYSAFVVFYRVYSFNDCPEAAKELREQIKEARDDLKRKGFVFD